VQGCRGQRARCCVLPSLVMIAASVGQAPPSYAQAFDGTWSGRDSCPAYGRMSAWSATDTATIVQNQFRLERNFPTLHELIEGMVQPDGSLIVSGQGERDDPPVSWRAEFSGEVTATTITLVGTRNHGRPCVIELTNTQPAPANTASFPNARRNQAAVSGRRAAEAKQRTSAATQRTRHRLQQKDLTAKSQQDTGIKPDCVIQGLQFSCPGLKQ
jgi:hypothetical protein